MRQHPKLENQPLGLMLIRMRRVEFKDSYHRKQNLGRRPDRHPARSLLNTKANSPGERIKPEISGGRNSTRNSMRRGFLMSGGGVPATV